MNRFTYALLAALLLTGCSGMPENMPDPENITSLDRCPSSPNCVSSADDPGDSHYIAPIRIQGDPGAAWQALQDMLDEDRSFEIVASNERYIRAVATTKILRFKDDVEFLLDRAAGTIGMRSASRIGYSDLGKNRSRMEDLRARMIEAGVAASP
ncbi:DUF1499 domain-containing protein [Wenzhouxiangella sp. XN79A]|uniref:DUF1499 domain-containing protein n=1 Tax=Wenzhouxiangella sp. XN79A TaxID=2724193 RepID=UPI00144AC6F6|nr:DUF1499 domain-containing protein [Wenzhouxiangella sp. XN79A]NKI34745.1 DUF1499 domain-containing protein [Wenzhouxiangella sp. XN79A]